jgi:2'-5' RNA ligase
MRLFAGIEIPANVKANLHVALTSLRPLADFRWSPIDNLHVTTKFIGEWPPARLPELQSALAARPTGVTPFDLALRGLGWFPNPDHPRVFWAGVHAGDELGALAVATDQALVPLGVAAETRPFRPHLTLARIGNPAAPAALRNSLESVRRGVDALTSQDFGSFRVLGFALYLSGPGPAQGAAQGKYTKLAEFPLANL